MNALVCQGLLAVITSNATEFLRHVVAGDGPTMLLRACVQGELSSEDLRELEEAVGAVEQRLHIAW